MAAHPFLTTDSQGHVGLALLSLSVLCIQYYSTSLIVIKRRRQIFNKDYMAQYDEMHKEGMKEVESAVARPNFGNPDGGDSRFSTKLTYK
jgi:hypothetical protein